MKFSDNEKYPDEIITIASEGIREEKNGKLMVLGLYAGDNIRVEGEAGLNLQSLTFLTVLKGGNGHVHVEGKLYDPNKKIIEKLAVDADLNPDSNVVLPRTHSPFHVECFGEYIFELVFDNDENIKYEYKLNILGGAENLE